MAETEKCFLGWNDLESNSKGKCCCNCKNQVKIMKHPWNKNDFANGHITEQIGYGCAAPELAPNIIFFDNAHGMCELYENKFEDSINLKALRMQFENWYQTTKYDKNAKWHEDEQRYTVLSTKQQYWESWKACFDA